MTKVHYDCVDKFGNKLKVSTLSQAQEIMDEGGSYEIIYTRELSRSEAHCRPEARRAGDLR